VGQGEEGRSIEDTLGLSCELMAQLPLGELKRVRDFIPKYHPTMGGQDEAAGEAGAPEPEPEAPAEEPAVAAEEDAAVAVAAGESGEEPTP
jgi:hypothetical protein